MTPFCPKSIYAEVCRITSQCVSSYGCAITTVYNLYNIYTYILTADDRLNFSPNDDDFEELAKNFNQKRQVVQIPGP